MADLPQGTEVAGCRIESVLGRGGMGVVYRARQLSLDRVVALKVIAPDFAMDDEFRERFKHESRLAASIEHANVIPVYEAGESDGQLYLIMRYVEGTDLRALIGAEGALAPARAARLVAQVAAALAAAHRRDLVHRDVKPANVLIGADGHAYLTDFGIARDLAATSGLTATGAVVGTLDYIAPERLEHPAGDARSDIYALGCVLFEALTGSVPFPLDSGPAKMYAHVSAPVPSARELRGDVPAPLDELARRSMAKDPDERPASAAELAEALLAAGAAVGAPSAPETQPAATEPLTPAQETQPAATAELREPEPRPRPAPPEPERRVPRYAVLAGLAMVAAVGVIALLALAGGGSDDGGAGSTDGPEPDRLDPVALAAVALSPGADGVAVGQGFVWVANKDRNVVSRIDPRTRKKVADTRVGTEPDSIAVGEGRVWVTNTGSNDVSRIDPTTFEVERFAAGRAPEGIAVGGGAAWVANQGAGTVTRIDAGGAPARTTRVGPAPIQVAVADDGAWVTVSGNGTVVQLDPETGDRAGKPVEVGSEPRGIAFGDGLLWVSVPEIGEIAVIDPDSRKILDRIDVGGDPREVRAGEGGIWVTNAGTSEVIAIDPGSRRVAGTVKVRGKPYGLGVGEGLVWAAGLDNGLITPIRPRR